MAITNIETAGLKAFKNWRKKGLIDDDDYQYLKMFYQLRNKGILSNDDFIDIKELYKLKHHGAAEFVELHKIKELYLLKTKGLINTLIDEPCDYIPKYDITKFYKLKLQERISVDKFNKIKHDFFELRGYGITYDDFQELNEFDKQRMNGNLSDDDFNTILKFFKNKICIFEEEMQAIKELFKQKIKGVITNEISEPGEHIPKFNFTRLYKLKLQGRISVDEFENFERQFLEQRCYIISHREGLLTDDELQSMLVNSSELDLLFFLIENREKNEQEQ